MFIRSRLTPILTAIISLAFLLVILPSRAAADDDDDPPSRVGRLSYLRGPVSLQPAGTDDWGEAIINRPLTLGDKLWSDQDALAEVSLGSAAVRLGSQTAFTILNLDDNVTQISVSEGTLNIHLRRLDSDDSFEVDTPNIAFSLLRPGDYRIGVNENGDTTIVTVRGGEGEVTGGGQAFAVHAGQSAVITGTDQIDSEVDDAYPNDDFDNWCNDRNRRADDVPRYVSPDMVGYDDLNENGQWSEVPDYGAMWVPTGVAVDWAPYRYGHWVWISPWGWTWVDDASWGFAPFHYGRWVQYRGRWGWLPGPVVVTARPVYAPALVAWVGGGGGGVAIGVGGAGVAWFPLGPREVFVPPYAVSRRYVTNVNVTNTNVTNVQVTNIYNNYTVNKNVTNVTYVNRTYVTATSRNTFVSAQPVGRNLGKVDAREIAKAPVGTAVGAGVAPQRGSVIAVGGGRVAPQPPSRFEKRAVVAKRPPPPAPVSFKAQQSELEKNGGKPIPRAQLNAMRPKVQPNAAPAAAPVKIAPTVRTMGAPTRVGKPGQPPPAAAGAKPPATTVPPNTGRPAAGAPPTAPAKPAAQTPPAAPARPATAAPPANPGGRPGDNRRPDDAKPTAPPPAAPPPAAKPPAGNPPPPANPNARPPSAQPGAPPKPTDNDSNRDSNRRDRNPNAPPPAPAAKPPAAAPDKPAPPPPNRPAPARPDANKPDNKPDNPPPGRPPRPDANKPDNPPAARPAPPPARPPADAKPAPLPEKPDRPPAVRPDNRPDNRPDKPNKPVPEDKKKDDKSKKDKDKDNKDKP